LATVAIKASFAASAWLVLCLKGMMPERRHHIGPLGVLRATGLAALICFIYRHFGPEAHGPVTPWAVSVFFAGVCLLLWPKSMNAKH
jgi:hypothetical protein